MSLALYNYLIYDLVILYLSIYNYHMAVLFLYLFLWNLKNKLILMQQ
jgi:hypothetical protein